MRALALLALCALRGPLLATAQDEQCLEGGGCAADPLSALPPEVMGRLEALELAGGSATQAEALDVLLDAVLEEGASTERALTMIRKNVETGKFSHAHYLKTWSQVLLRKRERDAQPPAAEREYGGPEEAADGENVEEEEELETIMEMSGTEMREQMAYQQGESPLKEGIISHLENASSYVNWTLLSAMTEDFVREQAEKAEAKAQAGDKAQFEMEGNKLVPVDPEKPKPVFPLPVMKGIEGTPITYTASAHANSTTVPLLVRAITMAEPGDGALDFVQLMLEHGADPNLVWPGKPHDCCWEYAGNLGTRFLWKTLRFPKIPAIIVRAGGQSSPFLEACRNNHLPLAERMLREYGANPLLGRGLARYSGAAPGLALPFALRHAPHMAIALVRQLQGLPTMPRRPSAKPEDVAARLCGPPHCPSLGEWRARSPTLASLLREDGSDPRRSDDARAPSWNLALQCVHEWYRPFLDTWLARCLETVKARGSSRPTRLPAKHGCASALHRPMPSEFGFALGGDQESTLWHALAALGDVQTMRYLRESGTPRLASSITSAPNSRGFAA